MCTCMCTCTWFMVKFNVLVSSAVGVESPNTNCQAACFLASFMRSDVTLLAGRARYSVLSSSPCSFVCFHHVSKIMELAWITIVVAWSTPAKASMMSPDTG